MSGENDTMMQGVGESVRRQMPNGWHFVLFCFPQDSTLQRDEVARVLVEYLGDIGTMSWPGQQSD